MADKSQYKVTLVKSIIGTKQDHRATVRGLGLRRIGHTVELQDTPAVRGMVRQVRFLVSVVELPADATTGAHAEETK